MEITQPFKKLIETNYKKSNFNQSDWIKIFFDNCFQDLIKNLHLVDYQSRASKTGKMFEYALWYLIKEKFDLKLENDYEIPKACMMGGGSLDFGIIKDGKLLCGIEAKGSADKVIHDDGTVETLSRPALKRTDTMKKAIAQAYQFKRVFPNIPFFIVTNVKPDSGNSKCMMELAEGDIVDRFIDVTNIDEIGEFVKTLKSI